MRAKNAFVTEPVVTVNGDVDANGVFDENDVDMLRRYLVKLGGLTDASKGDINFDGEIDVIDLVEMKRKLLGR